MTTDYSRSLLLAASAAGEQAESLRERIEAYRVHVSADSTIPGVATALRVLVADLRRLPVQLSLDPGHGQGRLADTTVTQIQRIAAGIDPERAIIVCGPPPGALHVRLGTDQTGADISGAPDGHGARLRRPGHPFPTLGRAGSGLGAVLTAALLTGEVFKIATALGPSTHRRLDVLDFCPVTLFAPSWAPVEHLHIDRVALVGAGAIGTAVVLAWGLRHQIRDDAEEVNPLRIHRQRIRTTHQALRDKNSWRGSPRALIDPNHSPAVEGDHYLGGRPTRSGGRATRRAVDVGRGVAVVAAWGRLRRPLHAAGARMSTTVRAGVRFRRSGCRYRRSPGCG